MSDTLYVKPDYIDDELWDSYSDYQKRYASFTSRIPTLEQMQDPSAGTKLKSAFVTDFGAKMVPDFVKVVASGIGTGPLGEAFSQFAATQSIEDWQSLTEDERRESLNKVFDPETGSDPLLDYASKLRQEGKAYIANKLNPAHKDYDKDYHAYVNWLRTTSIEEDGWFDSDVMQKVILQGGPSLVLSMGAGFTAGVLSGGNPLAALSAAVGTTFALESSAEFNEAIDYYMDEKGMSFNEAAQASVNSAWAYGIGAAALETLPSGRIFKNVFGATNDIARATNSGLFKRSIRKIGSKMDDGVQWYDDATRKGLGKGFDRIVAQGVAEALEEGSQYMTQTAIQAGYRDESFGELFDWGEFQESIWGGALLGKGTGTIGLLAEESQVVQKFKDARATPEDGGMQIKRQEDGKFDLILYGKDEDGNTIEDSRLSGYDTYKEASLRRQEIADTMIQAKKLGEETVPLPQSPKQALDAAVATEEATTEILDKQTEDAKKIKVEMPPRSDEAIILMDAMGNETSLTPREAKRLEELKQEGISGEQVEKSLTPQTLQEANITPEDAVKAAEELALEVPEDISNMVEPDVVTPLEVPEGDPSDIPTVTGESIDEQFITPDDVTPDDVTPDDVTVDDTIAEDTPDIVQEDPITEDIPAGPPQLEMFPDDVIPDEFPDMPEEFPDLPPAERKKMEEARINNIVNEFSNIVSEGGDINAYLQYKDIPTLEILSSNIDYPGAKSQIQAAIKEKKDKLPKRQAKGFKGGPQVPSRRTVGALREKLGLSPEEPLPNPKTTISITKAADALRTKTGIRTEFINDPSKKDAFGNPIKAFVEERDGAMVPVVNLFYAAESDVFHEYVHIVLAAMRDQNMPGFDSLWDSIKKEAWFSELAADVRRRYDYELSDANVNDFKEEVMAHAIGWLANDKYKKILAKEQHKSFKDTMLEFIKALAKAINKFLGAEVFNTTHDTFESIDVNKIVNMSLADFVDLMADTNRDIDLGEAWHSTGLKLADPGVGKAAIISHPAFYEDNIYDGQEKAEGLEEMNLRGVDLPSALDMLFFPFEKALKVPKKKYRPRKPKDVLEDLEYTINSINSFYGRHSNKRINVGEQLIPPGFTKLLELYQKAQFMHPNNESDILEIRDHLIGMGLDYLADSLDPDNPFYGADDTPKVRTDVLVKRVGEWIDSRVLMTKKAEDLITSFNGIDYLLGVAKKDQNALIDISLDFGNEDNPAYLIKKGRLTISEIELEMLNDFRRSLYLGKLDSDAFGESKGIIEAAKGSDIIKLPLFLQLYSQHAKQNYGIKAMVTEGNVTYHKKFFNNLGLEGIEESDINTTQLFDNHMPFTRGHTFDFLTQGMDNVRVSGSGFVWYVMGEKNGEAIVMEIQSDVLPEFNKNMQELANIQNVDSAEVLETRINDAGESMMNEYINNQLKYTFPALYNTQMKEILMAGPRDIGFTMEGATIEDSNFDTELVVGKKGNAGDSREARLLPGRKDKLKTEKFITGLIFDILIKERPKGSLWRKEYNQLNKDIIEEFKYSFNYEPRMSYVRTFHKALQRLEEQGKLPYWISKYNIDSVFLDVLKYEDNKGYRYTSSGVDLQNLILKLFPALQSKDLNVGGFSRLRIDQSDLPEGFIASNTMAAQKAYMESIVDSPKSSLFLPQYGFISARKMIAHLKKSTNKLSYRINLSERVLKNAENIEAIKQNPEAWQQFKESFTQWHIGNYNRYNEYLDSVYKPALREAILENKERIKDKDISGEIPLESKIFNRLYTSGSAQRMAIQHAMKVAKMKGHDKLYITGGSANAIGEGNISASSLYYTEGESNTKSLSYWIYSLSSELSQRDIFPVLDRIIEDKLIEKFPAKLPLNIESLISAPLGRSQAEDRALALQYLYESMYSKNYNAIAAIISYNQISSFLDEARKDKNKKRFAPLPQTPVAIQVKKTAGKKNVTIANSNDMANNRPVQPVFSRLNAKIEKVFPSVMSDLSSRTFDGRESSLGDIKVKEIRNYLKLLEDVYAMQGVEYYEISLTEENTGKAFKRLSKMDKPVDDDSQGFTIEPGSRAYDQVYNKIESAYKRSVGKIGRLGQTIEHNKIVAAIGEMIPSKYKNVFDDWIIKKRIELGDKFDNSPRRAIDNSQNILSTQETNEILRSSESEFIDDINGDSDLDVSTMTKSLYKIERKAFKALGITVTLEEEARILSKAAEIQDFDTWMQLIISEVTGKDPQMMKESEILAYRRLHLSVNNQVRVNHPDRLMNEKINIIIENHKDATYIYPKGEKTRMFLNKNNDDKYNSNPTNPKRERTTLIYHKYLSGEFKSQLVFLNGADILEVVGKDQWKELRESYKVLTDKQLKAMLWNQFLPKDIVPISTRGEEGGLIFARITEEHKQIASTLTSLKQFWDKEVAKGYITEADAAEMINTLSPMQPGNIARYLAMNEVFPGFMVNKEINEAGQEIIRSADAANIFKRIKIPFTPAITNGDMEATNMVLVNKEDIMFSFPDSPSKLGGMVNIKDLGKKYRADGATLTSRSAFNKMKLLGLKPGANKAKTVIYQKDGDNVIAVKHEHFALEPGMKIWMKSGALIGEVNDKGDIINKNGELIDFISTDDEAKIYTGYEDNIKNQTPITLIGKSIGLIKYADRQRPNATHPHQWYNYVRDKNIQQEVADYYINDENSPVKKILRKVFQIANSTESIGEFADQLDKNLPDVASTILIEKARAGAGLHPDIALFFDTLMQTRFASKAMSLEVGEGTYLDIVPNFRGDLKENEIALSIDNAREIVVDWANATNSDVKDASLAAINEWLPTRDYRVLTSRFPIPHIGGVSYARVKRLHRFKGLVEASPVMVFKRKEGDHDGDAMQVEFIPAGGLHNALRAYIDNIHTKTEAINLDRFTDKVPYNYANVNDVYKLKASIAYGGKSIQSIAAIQNVYGMMQDSFEGLTINGVTWNVIPGNKVVNLDFMEEGYSDTVNQKLRILLQAAVDNAQYMLLSKWNFDRNALLLSLFETTDSRGNVFNLAELQPGDVMKIQASIAINAIYKEYRRVGFIRNGGDFQSKSWGLSDLINNSEIYNEFVSNRDTYMASIFSEAGIEGVASFNDSVSVLEQMAITPFEMYQRYKKDGQLNSPYIYDDTIYANIHQDVLSEWDTEAKRVELIERNIELDINLGNYRSRQHALNAEKTGISYAKRMGRKYYELMDQLQGKIYPTTWDHNQEVREFMLEFDEEFKSMSETAKTIATLEFLRGVKKKDGTKVYNVKFMPPYSFSPEQPSLLSMEVMEEYNKLLDSWENKDVKSDDLITILTKQLINK